MKKIITTCLAIIIAFTSCQKDTIIGSGPKETVLRPVSGFTKIEVAGTTAVTVSYGSSFKVEVSAYRNLINKLETTLDGDVLKVGYKSGTSVVNDNAEVFITLPLLTKFSATGKSHVFITSGNADNFEAKIVGAGKIEGLGFTAANANITIEGSGTAAFMVTDKLNAKITGSGIVYYKGNAAVTSVITGSGKVEKL